MCGVCERVRETREHLDYRLKTLMNLYRGYR